MSFFHSVHLLLDDDADDADDFDLGFDEDYEYLSDEEFEVSIEDYEYGADESGIPDGFCMDDDHDGFGDFDASDDALTEKDYVDEAS
jgi:hypothetical protein